MWINSALGKRDQNALVEKALGDAERRRMLEAGRGAGEESRIGELFSSATARLGWQEASIGHVEVLHIVCLAPSVQDRC